MVGSPLSSTGAGRRADSPAANNSAAAASSLERLDLDFVTRVEPEASIVNDVCSNAAPSSGWLASVTPALESSNNDRRLWTLLVDSAAARPLDDPQSPGHDLMQLRRAIGIAYENLRLPVPDARQQ